MRCVLAIIVLIPLLFGCSITVDEKVPTDEKAEEAKNDSPMTYSDDYIVVEEDSVVKNFIELFFPEEKVVLAKPLKLLSLGDSLTDGVGDEYKKDGYVGRLAQSLETWPSISVVEVDNRGKRGRRSTTLLELLKEGHYDKELQEVQLITMTMGGNDVMKVVKEDLLSLKRERFDKERVKYAKRYTEILANIRERNKTVPIILIGFYNPFSIVTEENNEFDTIIDEWNNVMEELASEDPRACYVEVSDLFDSNDDMVYHSDFFHPNASGYEKMTERIVSTISDCGMEQLIKEAQGFKE